MTAKPPSDPAFTGDARRTAAFQIGLSVVMTALLGLASTLVLDLRDARQQGPTSECTLDNELEICGPEQECVGGRCRPLPPIVTTVLSCQDGERCGDCTCMAPFSCDADDRCRVPRADSCSPEATELFTRLRDFERTQCEKNANNNAVSCSPAALSAFFLSVPQFNTILLNMKQTISIHFDGRRTADHLSDAQQQAYRDQFEPLADRLRQAEAILLVARASRENREDDRTDIANRIAAQARLAAVQYWLGMLEPTPSGQDAMNRKLIRLAIGTESPLRPEVIENNPEHHIISWTRQKTEQLRSQLKNHRELSPTAASELLRTLNQSVLVVPIPCKLPPPQPTTP